MNRIKFKEFVWALLAFSPWLLIILAVVFKPPAVVNLSSNGLIIFGLIVIAIIAVGIAFTYHAWKYERVEWALYNFFFSLFAYPMYWWKFLRNQTPQSSQFYESSTSFDKENVKPFLLRLSKAIDSGLDSEKVNELLKFTYDVELEDQKQTEFYVTHQKQKVLVNYSVHADDIDSYGIYIFTSKELSELIDFEMEALFEELGM